MKTRIALAAAGLLAGCSTVSLNESGASPRENGGSGSISEYRGSPASTSRHGDAMSLERYKQMLAQKIASANPDKIYPGNPQAMLRSVVVVKYVLDGNGKLIHSDTVRTNGDSVTAHTALAALRTAAPFPPPPGHLLRRDRVEILETMLFNDDGRFQMRSTAAPQLEE